MSWALDQRWGPGELLNQGTLREVHTKMFGKVWTWAGQYRTREVNIGNCPPEEINVRMEQFLGNLAYQVEAGREPPDLCVEYHQSITQIHPFVNGNGRHARLTTERLAVSLGMSEGSITWGSGAFETPEDRRNAYLSALREADKGNFHPLRGLMFGPGSSPSKGL